MLRCRGQEGDVPSPIPPIPGDMTGDRLTVSCGCMGDVGLLTANWFIEGAEVLDLDVPRNPEMLRLSISIFRLPELVHVLPICGFSCWLEDIIVG